MTSSFSLARKYGLAALLLAAFLVQCRVWARLGYGPDEDGWGILGSWVAMKDDGIYVPSRNQGNLVAELLYGHAAHWGGAAGTTLVSFSLSLLSLLAYVSICRRFLDWPRALLALAFVVSCPYWVLRSVISTDYMPAVALFLSGTALYRSQWRLLGLLALALAGSARLQYAPLGLTVIVVSEWFSRNEPGAPRRALERLATYLTVVYLLYLPALIYSRLTSSFLNVFMPDWSMLSKLGRTYKVVFLFGFPTTVLLGACVLWLVSRRGEARAPAPEARKQWALLGAAVAATTLAMFVTVPIEPEYLFPLLFVAAAALASSPVPAPVIFLAALLMLVNGYTKVDMIEVTHDAGGGPCGETVALGARPGLTIEPGLLRRSGVEQQERERCLQEIMRGHLSEGGIYGGEVVAPELVPTGVLFPDGD